MIFGALSYGLYLGLIGFTVPVVLPLYSFYYSVRDAENIGAFVFFGSLSAYITMFMFTVFSQKSILENPILHTVLTLITLVLCAVSIIKLIFDFIHHNEADIFHRKKDTVEEEVDLYSKKSGAEIVEESDIKGSKTTVFFSTFLFSLASVDFIHWCDFSLYSVMAKLNSDIVALVILFTVLIAVQLVANVIFSKLSVMIGKYIRPLMMRPFLIIIISLFLGYAVYSVISIMNNFV